MKAKCLALFFISILFLFSCKKELSTDILEESIEPPCWELHPDIELDRRLLIQGFANEDHLFLLSNNYFLKMDETGLLQEKFISEEGNISLFNYPMLNEKLFAMGFDLYSVEKLTIYSTANPEIFTNIDLKSIDSTFNEINYFSGNGMAANDSNKLLFSVSKKYIQGVSDPYLYFWMFDVTLESDVLSIEFDKEIKIEIPGTSNTLTEKSVTELTVFENEFYCSINRPDKTYKINSEGDFEELFPMRDAKIFERNDTLFALGHVSGCDIGYAIKPSPTVNWETYSLGVYDGCWGTFYQIKDKFIMVNRYQFWEVEINHSESRFDFKELDGNCIQETSFRSLTHFKDKIYIATHEGLYFKSLDDFFIYKEE